MDIRIRVADPADREAQLSLYTRLVNDPDVRANAKISFESAGKEAMGVDLDAINLALDTTFKLATLALAIAKWRRDSESATTSLVVEQGGVSATLTPDDMTDHKVIHRALSGAPDPRRSICVLIGVSDYSELPPLPAVEENVLRLENVLMDPEIWGIPRERLRKIEYPRSADDILPVLAEAANDASDALVVYYAGHGLYDANEGLLLALPDASGDGRQGTVPWYRLAEIIRLAQPDRRVVILDCCYSGRAIEGGRRSPGLVDAAKAEGVYTIAAAQKDGLAIAPDGEDCTAFTGELVRVLRDGIPAASRHQEFLSLNAIEQKVRRELHANGHPRSQRDDPGGIGQNAFVRNRSPERQTQPESPPLGESGSGSPYSPGNVNLNRRRLVDVGIGVLGTIVILAAAVLLWNLFSQKNDELGGVNLTEFCSSQKMVINGGYCFKPVNYVAACNWQYNTTGLHFKFTDPSSLESGVCYRNKPSKSDKGITDMHGYCAYYTGVPDVTATDHSPIKHGAWVCQKEVDMYVVCVSQYKIADVQARKDDDGNWMCYE